MNVHFKEDWNCIVNSCFLFSETVHCLLISHKGLIFTIGYWNHYMFTLDFYQMGPLGGFPVKDFSLLKSY